MNFCSTAIKFFDISFWQNFVTTFLGAVLGIFAALYTDRLIKRYQTKNERNELRLAIKESLNKNLSIIANLKDQYNKINKPTTDYLPLSSLDISFLKSASMRKFDIMQMLQSREGIYDAIHELSNLSEILELLRNLATYTFGLTKDERVYQFDLVVRCQKQLEVTESVIKKVIRQLTN